MTGVSDHAAVSVRPARPDDADAIATLFTDEGYPTGPSDVRDRLASFGAPASRVLVADLDGQVLGFVAIHALARFEHSDWIVRVMALVVAPDARERGVGHRLMGEAEQVARDIEAAFIEVTAGHHRPEARHLYESLGYDATVAAYFRKRL